MNQQRRPHAHHFLDFGKSDRFELRKDRVIEKCSLFFMNCFENFPHDANSCGERVALLGARPWASRGLRCLRPSLGAYPDMSIKRPMDF
ncbi:hypothetical protein DO70_5260 [Burkholderia pseudomallei]|nr:hypothetical protein DO70_5260 [Burkholderia pseudomallei]